MRINYLDFSYQRKQLEPYFNDFVASVFYFIKGLHEDVFEQNEYEELDEYTERINEFNEFIKTYLEELDDDEYCTHFDAFYEENRDKEEPLAEAIWEALEAQINAEPVNEPESQDEHEFLKEYHRRIQGAFKREQRIEIYKQMLEEGL